MPVFSEPLYSSRPRRFVVAAAALLGTPLLMLVLLRVAPQLDVLFVSTTFHLIVVSGIAACALAVAVLASLAATKARDASPLFLSLGCLALAAGMLGHGLVTPASRECPTTFGSRGCRTSPSSPSPAVWWPPW
jgi:hypothetical protein